MFYVVSTDEKSIDSLTLYFRFSIDNDTFYSVMNNDKEIGVSSHNGKYSGHLKLSCLHIT